MQNVGYLHPFLKCEKTQHYTWTRTSTEWSVVWRQMWLRHELDSRGEIDMAQSQEGKKENVDRISKTINLTVGAP